MDKNDLKPGDVVQLTSGSQDMTFGYIDIQSGRAMCYWMYDHEVKSMLIPIVALRNTQRTASGD